LKQLFFRIKITLLYPVGVLMVAYYKAVKNIFPAHGSWLRLNIPRFLGKTLLALYGMKLDINGEENLDCLQPGRVVVFANHNSRLDPYVLFAVLPVPYKSFWSTRAHVISEHMDVVRWYGESMDLFFLHDKSDVRRTAREFRKATDYVNAGNVMSFFPEGQFSESGLPADFGVACARLAIEAKAQILPIVIHGTEAYFEQAERVICAPVRVTVCSPISTGGFTKKEASVVSKLLESNMRKVFAALQCELDMAEDINC